MKSFFFYDLETSGFSPRNDRIMQFAGQRTNMDLEPTGEPVNILIKLTDDILPSPGAILTTHITPQKTLEEGISEADFCREFLTNIATPDTIILGYNSIRFDDEFMRHTLWRNFHDPYEWAWSENRSRWDLLDVTRFVRALRPDGINWPMRETYGGNTKQTELKPTVNLVDMAKSNGFENEHAHDALADVYALIGVAKLLRDKQPKMWQYLFEHRSKQSILQIVKKGTLTPFVYTSGKYPSQNEKTTVAVAIGDGKTPGSILVWDLRYKPSSFAHLTDKEISDIMIADYETRQREDYVAIPTKELSPNKCPAVAPIGVLDDGSQERIHLSMADIQDNLKDLKSNIDFINRVAKCWLKRPDYPTSKDVESRLYDGFMPDADKTKIRLVASANANELADMHPEFIDERLSELLLRYKARQYPKSLTDTEEKQWQKYRVAKLSSAIPKYMAELQKLAQSGKCDDFILQELQLWAESIMPVDY